MRKPAKDMVYIGQEKLQLLFKHTGLSVRDIAEQMKMTNGGWYYITHKSGKMDIKDWKKFKQIYKKETGDLPDVDESGFDEKSRKELLQKEKVKKRLERSKKFNLKNIETKQLISELERRGYNITRN